MTAEWLMGEEGDSGQRSLPLDFSCTCKYPVVSLAGQLMNANMALCSTWQKY